MFEPINFQNLNETDIREEILAPLIRRLGYRSGSEHNVIREQSLRYPRIFIGRKNSKKDPILRGIADYILEAGEVRWVIEAKAPQVEIDVDTVEQAYTYANHPEVRAVYFSLSNGRRLVVFQTNRGPKSEPVLDLSYDEFENKYKIIESLLSPSSILNNNPKANLDIGTPIGKGLRSVVRITNGVISYHGNSLNIPALREMQTTISGGAVERDEKGSLVAFLNTIAPTRSMQNLNKKLGLSSFEMFSNDIRISSDTSKPTIFRSEQTITIPAGEKLLDINSWEEITLPINMICKVISQASGHLEDNKFYGDFISSMEFHNMAKPINLNGKYEIYVA